MDERVQLIVCNDIYDSWLSVCKNQYKGMIAGNVYNPLHVLFVKLTLDREIWLHALPVHQKLANKIYLKKLKKIESFFGKKWGSVFFNFLIWALLRLKSKFNPQSSWSWILVFRFLCSNCQSFHYCYQISAGSGWTLFPSYSWNI